MMGAPLIPLTVGQLPLQRVHEVVDLPPLPALAVVEACLDGAPAVVVPKHRPRHMTCLGIVEWAWSPMSSRLDVYFLHSARRHWLLWIRDPFAVEAEYEWRVAAYALRSGLSQHVAATHLLVALWKEEATERHLDHFHWISAEGELTVADWMAIGRAVWPPTCIPDDALLPQILEEETRDE
jgi:hypothetical protein